MCMGKKLQLAPASTKPPTKPLIQLPTKPGLVFGPKEIAPLHKGGQGNDRPSKHYVLAGAALAAACMIANICLNCWFYEWLPEGFLAEDLGAAILLALIWFFMYMRRRAMPVPVPVRMKKTLPDDVADTETACSRTVSGKGRRTLRRQLRHSSLEHLHDVLDSLRNAAPEDDTPITKVSLRSRVKYRSLHNYHVSCGQNVVLPVEVAACHYSEDVSEHLQRMMEDQWAALDSGLAMIMPLIAEDGTL